MGYSLGADPELFLRSKKTGEFISADGKFPGTKKKPHKLDHGAVQVDGLALEFNIDPAHSAEEFTHNIQTVLNQLRVMVSEVSDDLEMVFTPYAKFDPKYFETIPDEAKILGCDADFDYHGNINPRPEIMNEPFRTAAGHIHIGWTENQGSKDIGHFEDCRFVSNFFFHNVTLDAFPNMYPSVLQARRLVYYGMRGSFRPKSYGVELRSPSNEWVENADHNKLMYDHVIGMMNGLHTNY